MSGDCADGVLDGVAGAGRSNCGGSDSGGGEHFSAGGGVSGENDFSARLKDSSKYRDTGGSGPTTYPVADRGVRKGRCGGEAGDSESDSDCDQLGAGEPEWPTAGTACQGCC